MIYLYFKYKQGIGQELVISAIISFAWVTYSGIYNYSDSNIIFHGINIFPFIAWTAGLVILREVYERLKGSNRFIKATAFYILILLSLEYIGYNTLGIQLTTHFDGFMGLPLLHAPLFAQVYYLSVGPIYLWITDYLKVE